MKKSGVLVQRQNTLCLCGNNKDVAAEREKSSQQKLTSVRTVFPMSFEAMKSYM